MMIRCVIDHLVLGSTTLQAGLEYVEGRFGVAAQLGGKHARMGTHNALLTLGERTYLEILAIDPDGGAPFQARWFGLDDGRTRARLARGPALLGWVARSDDIEQAALASRVPVTTIHAMARGDFRWRITIPADGRPIEGALLPTLIQWDVPMHPTDKLPEQGCRLLSLSGTHPRPEEMHSRLSSLNLENAINIEASRNDAAPGIAAQFATPKGVITVG
jgi:hypothetical protein